MKSKQVIMQGNELRNSVVRRREGRCRRIAERAEIRDFSESLQENKGKQRKNRENGI